MSLKCFQHAWNRDFWRLFQRVGLPEYRSAAFCFHKAPAPPYHWLFPLTGAKILHASLSTGSWGQSCRLFSKSWSFAIVTNLSTPFYLSWFWFGLRKMNLKKKRKIACLIVHPSLNFQWLHWQTMGPKSLLLSSLRVLQYTAWLCSDCRWLSVPFFLSLPDTWNFATAGLWGRHSEEAAGMTACRVLPAVDSHHLMDDLALCTSLLPNCFYMPSEP